MKVSEFGDIVAAPCFAIGAAYFWERKGLMELALLMFMIAGAIADVWFTWQVNKKLGILVGFIAGGLFYMLK